MSQCDLLLAMISNKMGNVEKAEFYLNKVRTSTIFPRLAEDLVIADCEMRLNHRNGDGVAALVRAHVLTLS